MTYYRLYFMHPWTGHIERVAELDARDDGEAVARCADHAGEYPLELWNGGRKVHRIEAVAARAAREPARPAAVPGSFWKRSSRYSPTA